MCLEETQSVNFVRGLHVLFWMEQDVVLDLLKSSEFPDRRTRLGLREGSVAVERGYARSVPAAEGFRGRKRGG